MIPTRITRARIEEAIRRIIHDGVPPRRRRGRGHCLATKGEHLPPKYTIALAHQVATGELLRPDRLSGGSESNEFLRRRGFAVAECHCGGSIRDGRVTLVSPPSVRRTRTIPSRRHPEGCRARARSGSASFWSVSAGRACSTTDSDGGPASQLTREP